LGGPNTKTWGGQTQKLAGPYIKLLKVGRSSQILRGARAPPPHNVAPPLLKGSAALNVEDIDMSSKRSMTYALSLIFLSILHGQYTSCFSPFSKFLSAVAPCINTPSQDLPLEKSPIPDPCLLLSYTWHKTLLDADRPLGWTSLV
jgi:hypothetical protein